MDAIHWTICERDPAWLETASQGFLSEQEIRRLEQLRFPKRRQEWLLGRWTAKHLLKAAIPALDECEISEISVANQPEGAPYFSGQNGSALPYPVSISHRDCYALCAVSALEHMMLGVDIEKIEQRSGGFLEDYFSAAEQDYAHQLCHEDLAVWITAAWSLKESVLKALGTGLRVDIRTVTVGFGEHASSFHPNPSDWQPVQVDVNRLTGKKFSAYWVRKGQFVLTLVHGVELNSANLELNFIQC